MKKSPQQIWNTRYAGLSELNKTYTPWLDRWRGYLVGDKALDIGCGTGFDTEALIEYGFDVTAIDFSEEALRKSRERNPQADHLQRDLSQGLQLYDRRFTVAVANLSLHYFSKKVTLQLVRDIWTVLEDDGFFAFRVNAVGDTNYGSPEKINGWDVVETDEVIKQFFTREKIIEMLQKRFRVISVKQFEDAKYGTPKLLYECAALKISD